MGLGKASKLIESMRADGVFTTHEVVIGGAELGFSGKNDCFSITSVDLQELGLMCDCCDSIELSAETGVSVDDIEHIIFNDPATIVIFKDGTKEVVKTTEGDLYQPDIGVAMALARKLFGSRSQYKKFVKKFMVEDEQEDDPSVTWEQGLENAHKALSNLKIRI